MVSTPRTIHAVIFDMDGVLFDSEPVHILSWQAFLRSLSIQKKASWFTPWIGKSDKSLAVYMQSELKITLGLEEIINRKRSHFHRLIKEQLKPFPGVIEGIGRLRKMNVPYALASSSCHSEIANSLATTGLADFFPVIVGAEDVVECKPAPEAYLKACQFLGWEADRCAAIEDSPAGIESAQGAGCLTLAVTTSHGRQVLKNADRVFASTREAIEWTIHFLCGPPA